MFRCAYWLSSSLRGKRTCLNKGRALKLQQGILDSHQKISKACCSLTLMVCWQKYCCIEQQTLSENFFLTMGYIYYTRSVWNACSEATISVDTSWVALLFEPCILLTSVCISLKLRALSVSLNIELTDVTSYIGGLGRLRYMVDFLFSADFRCTGSMNYCALSGRSTSR